MTDNTIYEFWLGNIQGIGIRKQKRLLAHANPRQLFEMSREEISSIEGIRDKDTEAVYNSRDMDKLLSDYNSLRKNNIDFIGISSPQYPNNLRHIYDAPIGLYFKGDKYLDNSCKIVAVVGSRDCTPYGREIAFNISRELANAGVVVISGMARGIDTYAHRGCMAGGGRTYAVLAGGVDVCYPRENIELYCDICRNGGIFSEFPTGMNAQPQFFPIRNRIISGIADCVVVVEARLRSGSLITADAALEQNKNIYVVPGRIGDTLSEGCLWLAKQGAQLLTGVDDILQELGIDVRKQPEEENFKISLAPYEKMLYSRMCLFPKSLNTIIEETGLTLGQITPALMGLELKGLIKEVGCHYYCKR